MDYGGQSCDYYRLFCTSNIIRAEPIIHNFLKTRSKVQIPRNFTQQNVMKALVACAR